MRESLSEEVVVVYVNVSELIQGLGNVDIGVQLLNIYLHEVFK